MKRIVLIFTFIFAFLLSACSVVYSISHPADSYFANLQYPRLGYNQISTKSLKKDPSLINRLAKFDFVIVNKSDDLFVDGNASYDVARQLKGYKIQI